jgi:hypothetical protein
MPVKRSRKRWRRRGPRPAYEIVLVNAPGADPQRVASAVDANEATLAFHATLQQLRRERTTGELWVRRFQRGGQIVLREPLCECQVSDQIRDQALT